MKTCRMGAPAYISYPHFYGADPALLEDVEGLQPDPGKHEFYMDINSVRVVCCVVVVVSVPVFIKKYVSQIY